MSDSSLPQSTFRLLMPSDQSQTEEVDEITSFPDSPSSFYSASSHFTTADDDSSCSDGVASSSYSSSHFDTPCPNLTICAGSSSSSSSSSATAAAPPSSSSSNSYEVFLSFRGTDTRHSFVSHLYSALTQKGITTFKDDKDLERGKQITPEILRAIRQSRLSVVVFSKDYASSSWCLDELQTIVDCSVRKNKDEKIPHTLLPIFYGVNPDDVSNVDDDDSSCYAESFAKHHKLIPDDKLQIWKSALKTAAESSGWDSNNRDEKVLIEEIVSFISKKLVCHDQVSNLVGMEVRIKEMESRLSIGLVDVRMVGIWGMPGIGKTTIAKAVYDHINPKFDACCFLWSIREAAEKATGLKDLRKELVSALMGGGILDDQNLDVLMNHRFRHRCVLIVLDDVSDVDQLASLAGDRNWFGPGSRIIITTHNKQVIEQIQVDEIYEARPLSDDESRHLFRQHAFGKSGGDGQDRQEFLQRAVGYCRGIPLAVRVLGGSLFNKNRGEWESRLKTLEEAPPEDIINSLTRACFDVLQMSEKRIFLDIACFFKGEDEDYVVSILEDRDCPARYGLGVLRCRCLISSREDNTNKVWMHDLMQQMGRRFVRQESSPYVGSRLWLAQEIFTLLAKDKGTDKVEAIIFDISEAKTVSASPLDVEAFRKMSKLRFLRICSSTHQSGSREYLVRKEPCSDTNDECRLENHDSLPQEEYKLHFSGKLISLSNDLRVLHWYEFPLESFPADFYPCNLVELNLSYSRLKNLWTGKKVKASFVYHGQEVFDNLKFMKLSYCKKLTQTPDFRGTKNLEILILEGCSKLKTVHQSVGSLEKLKCLNLKDCKRLRNLPKRMGTASLEILVLSGCLKLSSLPEMERNMGNLKELLMDGTAISCLPGSIANLTGLVELSVTNCKRIQFFPVAVGCCRSLQILRLTGCSELRLLDFDLDRLENLEELHADGTRLWLKCMMVNPGNDRGLWKLKKLTFKGCERSPFSLRDFFRDHMSQSEPARNTLQNLFWFGNSDRFCGTRKVSGLTSLDLSDSNLKELPFELKGLACLIELDLSRNPIVRLSELPERLRILVLANCDNLLSLPSLPSSTYIVEAPNCKSLSKVDQPQTIEPGKKRGLNFMNCNQLGDYEVPSLLQFHVVQTPFHSVDRMSILAPRSRMPSQWLLQNGHVEECTDKASMLLLHPNQHSYATVRGLFIWANFESVSDSHCRAKASLRFDMSCDGEKVESDEIELNQGTVCDSGQLWLSYVPIILLRKMVRGKNECLIEVAFETTGVLLVKSCGIFLARQHQDGHFLEPWITDTAAI